eukprot:6211221-Pleurochrysis_carterae.AAC.2
MGLSHAERNRLHHKHHAPSAVTRCKWRWRRWLHGAFDGQHDGNLVSYNMPDAKPGLQDTQNVQTAPEYKSWRECPT